MLRPGLENGFQLPLVPGENFKNVPIKAVKTPAPDISTVNPSIHSLAINLYTAVTKLEI